MDAAKREHARLLFHRYGNRNGGSGVAGYALLADGIAVKFANGAVYVYDRGCPGRLHVTRMKQLAREGAGLATYISRRVGQRYAARLDAGATTTALARSHAHAQSSSAPQSSTRQNTALR
jgi:hypothetical protein